ncbi:MAG: TonB-dependent receptor [Pseudomonadota bacterium]
MRRPALTLLSSVVASLLLLSGASFSADPLIEDEIVVTAQHRDPVTSVPNSVSTIDEDQIAELPANTLTDLLSREANVNLQSFFGNDKFTSLDIRGFGETAVSNVLVLVDGVRRNGIDLSGVDFSAIPIDSVSRIETLRGAGFVRYGSGAVGGVINILLKRPSEEPTAELKVRYGDYGTRSSSFSASAGHEGLTGRFLFSAYDTDGYRRNSGLTNQHGSVEVFFDRWTWLSLSARATIHSDKYQLPGPVPLSQFRLSEAARRSTATPLGAANSILRRYDLKGVLNFGNWGRFEVIGEYRHRENPFLFARSPLLTVPQQDSKIIEINRNFDATYTLPFELGPLRGEVIGGGWAQVADGAFRENGRGVLDRSTEKHAALENYAGFASLRLSPLETVTIDVGYRHDRFSVRRRFERLVEDCDVMLVPRTFNVPQLAETFPGSGIFITVLIPVTVNDEVRTNCQAILQIADNGTVRHRSEAFEASVSLRPAQSLTLWARFGQSFRNPNTDELLLEATPLVPQVGSAHWEGGLRYSSAPVTASLAIFDMTIDNEIRFGRDLATNLNVNLNLDEPVRRRGGEFELKVRPAPAWSLWGNAGFQHVRREDTNLELPLVPNLTGTIGLTWRPREACVFTVVARHVAERLDGNDEFNDRFTPLGSYELVDALFKFEKHGLALSFGINNLLDEVYSTTGFSDTRYPMADRNVYASVSIRI